MSSKKLTKNETHDMDVQFFMQKVMLLFIYYENRTMRYKINLIAWRYKHQALIIITTMYSHLSLDKHQWLFEA
jgi:hypothetical protein